MFAKIEITGTIKVVTGMHIGDSSAFAAIGAIDSPVIRDSITGYPIIPGSSLKGKMRTLLAKYYNDEVAKKPDDDDERLLRLFGCSASDSKRKSGKLIFSDMILSNEDALRKRGAKGSTEIKFENTINRVTGAATPRQIERVIRDAEFPLYLIYEADNEAEIKEDFQTIADGLKLLQYDYIGGSGSRGYGRIKFENLDICEAVGDEIEEEIREKCLNTLKAVEAKED